ncbi:MAG: tetratricopeptide repeat protein, partial [Cyanobacteria bacterium J06639_18]
MNCIYRIFICLSIVFSVLFLPIRTEAWAINDISVNARAVLESGVNQIQKGKYTEAIESLTQAIEIDPDLGQAYYHRCSAYLQTSD